MEHDCVYVGKTTDPVNRIREHFYAHDSAWTQEHRPLYVIDFINAFDANAFDEDKYVKQYMLQYGIDKARGGTYSSMHLDEPTKQFLQKELHGAVNHCFRLEIRPLCRRMQIAATFVSHSNFPILHDQVEGGLRINFTGFFPAQYHFP